MSSARIFIVEDEAIVNFDLCNKLKDAGYRVVGSEFNGEDALTKINKLKPDLAIVDIKIGGKIDGIDLANAIKKESGIPVIFLTAYADKDTLQRAKLTEPYAYILKPMKDQELYVAIEMSLYKYEMQDKLIKLKQYEIYEQLIGSFAHIFNNIFTPINGYCSLLIDTQLKKEEFKNIYKSILRQGQYGEKIIKQLLTYTGRLISKPAFIDINQFLNDHMPVFHDILGDDIDLQINFSNSNNIILIDEKELLELFMNLLLNAQDSFKIEHDNTIKIIINQVRKDQINLEENLTYKEYIQITVSDSGIGINKNIIDKIFNPFFTTKSVGEGTGLGLAVVYGILKKNNGFIEVKSKQNLGSSFIFYLPKIEELERKIETEEEYILKEGQGETVLIIEDDESMRNFLKYSLAQIGYRTISAANKFKALTQIEKDHTNINLVVTNIKLPGNKTEDFIKEIIQKYSYMKLLITYSDTEINFTHSSVLYLVKPFDIKKLSVYMRTLLDNN
jgi:signal transduction histidine kinase